MTAPVANLLARAQRALVLSQGDLGIAAGSSRRSGQRWAVGRAAPSPAQLVALAGKVHPVDPALAAELAAAGESSLAALGLATESPLLPRTHASALRDSVVAAAADAMEVPPARARAGLLAAFDRAKDLGLTLDGIEASLRDA